MKKKVVKGKDMRVDELAIMVAKGFERIDKRFEGVDKNFNSVESRFDGIEKDIKEIKDDVQEIKIGHYGNRIDRLEDSMRVVKTSLKLK